MLTDGRTDDGRTTDAGVIGILIAHLGAFGSGELKMDLLCTPCILERLMGGSRGRGQAVRTPLKNQTNIVF